MRQILCVALAASALASAATAAEAPPSASAAPREHHAVSAERYAVRASYNEGHGYSERARHIATCLATYPGYDHRTDRIRLSGGVTRRCNL